MTTSKRIALVSLWALSLIIVGAFAHAQTTQPRIKPVQPGTIIPGATVMSGGDIGFRIQGREGDRVLGTLVVRINGEWVVAEPVGGVKKLTSHIE
jgi:hypothetical protein